MMKKNLKHAAAIALLVGFAALALGSGSSPKSSGGSSSSGSSSSSSSRCPEANLCYWLVDKSGKWSVNRCSRSSCNVQSWNAGGDTTPGASVRCDCP